MHIEIAAEKVFEIFGWPITNSLLLGVVVFVFLSVVALVLHRTVKRIPGKLQNLFEIVLEQLLELMDTVLGDRHSSERYLPLIATIFLFILISNWTGLLPLVGSVGFFYVGSSISGGEGGHEAFVPLFRAPAADLNFTLALAVISVIAVNVLGVAAIGFFKHFGKYFHIGNPINMFIGLLEFVSEFVKMISLSFRLFGNVFAGEVLLTIIAFLVPYVIPLPFLFFEILVGFVQAFVFTLLTLVFLSMAVGEHEAH